MALAQSINDLFRGRFPKRRVEKWPFISGPYYVLDATAPVIVVTPDNDRLAEELVALSVRGLCMASSACRNAADVEKLIRNVDANLALHCIILAGRGEAKVSAATEALIAIFNGSEAASEKAAAIAHSVKGKLRTLDLAALQKRVKVVDLLRCSEIDKVIAAIKKYGSEGIRPDTGFVVQSHDTTLGIQRVIAPARMAREYRADKAGRYVIGTNKKFITLEHYNSKDELLRVIEGATARDLCILLVSNGWISRLDHAAYLGRELALAETAIKQGVPYKQSMLASANEDSLVADKAE